ncbi:BnaAnng37750D [Brassica napus]|uniref:BnaAnng37750D protein n=1 Tax=Brassica napus TaxID=3708 RepID=A0A078JYM7_BRANA|nr:BnaAnng37750D [Brassica napus]
MKDREARANASDGTGGAGTSKGKEIDGREAGDGKSLVAYTGAPSNRGNNDQEYLRRSDLDALMKLLKENGNIFGYSFGARVVENYKNLTRTDRMHESLIEMLMEIRFLLEE